MAKRILLLFLGLCLGLTLTEFIARWTYPSYANGVKLFHLMESERGKFCQYDPALGWDGTPNASGDFEWIDCHSFVRQNQYGYRSSAYPFARSDKKRVLVLGDSFVWGFGVDNEDMFPRLVEKESSPSQEIISMGVSGYGTDQELLLYHHKAHTWKPDTVWLAVNFLTDLYDISDAVRYGYPKPLFRVDDKNRLTLLNVPVAKRPQPWSDPAQSISARVQHVWADRIHRSALACLALTALAQNPTWRETLEKNGLVLPLSAGYDWEKALYTVPYDPSQEKQWALLTRLTAELSKEVTANGGRLVLVLVPSIVQVYPQQWDSFIKRSLPGPGKRMEMRAPTERLKAMGQKLGLNVIDLLPDLQEAGQNDAHLYFPVNMHWTRAGHRVVANTLLKHLAETTP